MKLRKVLVPLDGSVLAEAALPRAVELVASSGAKLLLLRAVETNRLSGIDRTEAQLRAVREAEDYLTRIGDRLTALGVKDIEVSIWYGPAVSAIVQAAQLHPVDLIVMTTHGRSGLGRLVLGSVAESVLRGTTTPILLVRAPEAPVEPPTPKGVAKPWPEMKRA